MRPLCFCARCGARAAGASPSAAAARGRAGAAPAGPRTGRSRDGRASEARGETQRRRGDRYRHRETFRHALTRERGLPRHYFNTVYHCVHSPHVYGIGIAYAVPEARQMMHTHTHTGVCVSNFLSEHEQANHDEGAEQQQQAREDGLLLLLARERASRLRGVRRYLVDDPQPEERGHDVESRLCGGGGGAQGGSRHGGC